MSVVCGSMPLQASFKLFLEVILLWGGPQLANFVALNLCGPEVHSIYRWRSQHRVVLNGGILLKNFKKLACVYENVMKIHGLSSVPVLAAEDETAIIGQVTYNEAKDELLGFCGVNGDHHHQCLDSFCVPVGDGEEGYNAITSAFNSYKIGTFAQAIILNPLHPKLPRLPVLIMATCNKFDSDFVFRQWPGVQRLYEAEIEPIVDRQEL